MKNNSLLFEQIKKRVYDEYPKEYLCHIQFVVILAREFQEKKGGDLEVIDIAAIAHDIGRKEGTDNKLHSEMGSTRIIKWLDEINYSDRHKMNKISRSVLMHNEKDNFKSIEEEIISNADALSKLRYHENFMLMCKKENYIEKAEWGLKYVKKGFEYITFNDVRESYQELYNSLVVKYRKVLD